MNIKSLLLGSAAALVAVSGARAADVIVADPEPVEYVRVCDAYGTGFFYIPGTEICLKIGGYVRYEVGFGRDYEFLRGDRGDALVDPPADDANTGRGYSDYGWTKNTRGHLTVDARQETEYGTLTGFMALQGNSSTGAVTLDEAYISLGGLYLGYSDNPFDDGINGEFDSLGGAKVNRIAYTFSAGGFEATLSIDDDGDVISGIGAFPTAGAVWAAGDNNPIGLPLPAGTPVAYTTSGADIVPNVSGKVGGTFGAFTAYLYGAYDNDTDNFAIKGRLRANVTSSGEFDLAAYYTDGPTYVLGRQQVYSPLGVNGYDGYASSLDFWGEWSVAASYKHTFNPKLAVTVGGQYIGNFQHADTVLPAGLASPVDINAWRIGTVVDYNITDNFATKLAVNYTKIEGNFPFVNWNSTGIPPAFPQQDLESWSGFLRFERSF